MKNNFFTNLMMRSAGGGMDATLRKHLLSSDTIATTNQRRSETDQQPISNRCRVSAAFLARIAAMLLMLVTMSVGEVRGETVTVGHTFTSDEATRLNNRENIVVGTGKQTYTIAGVYTFTQNKDDKKPVVSYDNGIKFGDNGFEKSGIAVFVPSDVDDVAEIRFFIKTSNTGRTTAYASGNPCPTTGTNLGTLTTSYSAYHPWNSYSKNMYYAVGGQFNGSGNIYIEKIEVDFISSAPSTKTVYMKAGEWNGSSPKFFAYSWKGSNNQSSQMVSVSCESDVYSVEVPVDHEYVIFTRQASTTNQLLWEGTGFWNKSVDIALNTNDLFTFSTWHNNPPTNNDNQATFTPGTYSAPTYSITYMANGGTGSDVVVDGIECGGSHTVKAADTFTRTNWSFLTWKQGGTGTERAAGSTIENITSNIELYAHWYARSIYGELTTQGYWEDHYMTDNSVVIHLPAGVTRYFGYKYHQTDVADAFRADGTAFTATGESGALTGNTGNMSITTTIEGDYTFAFDPETKKISVTFPTPGVSPVACAHEGHIYAYNDANRIVDGVRKNPLGSDIVTSPSETSISGNLPNISVPGLTAVTLTSCYSEYKSGFAHLASYIKAKTSGSSIKITLAVGYTGALTIKFGAYSNNKSATVTNAANSATATSDQRSAEAEDDFTSKTIALVSGDNVLTITGSNNAYISHMDIVTVAPPTTYAVTYNNGGRGTAPGNTTASQVTLSEITGVDGWTNIGWKANVATTVDDAAVAANTLIANGKTVVLSSATTFTAQWEKDAAQYTFANGSTWYFDFSEVECGGKLGLNYPAANGGSTNVEGCGQVFATTFQKDIVVNLGAAWQELKLYKGNWQAVLLPSSEPALGQNCLKVSRDGLTAEWSTYVEPRFAVYSLTSSIGSAEVTAADATIDANSLKMSNNAGRIKISPICGMQFKNGDKISFSGSVGKTSENFGLKVWAADGRTSAGEIYVAGTTNPLEAEGTLTLSDDQDYIYIGRYGGTTTTLKSLEITRTGVVPTTYAVTASVDPAEYGTISKTGVASVLADQPISADGATLDLGCTTITATPEEATAEYTYSFDNWTWTESLATVTKDITATAHFTRAKKQYTITWVTDGDELTGEYTKGLIDWGTEIVAPNTPTKTGYTFTGWDAEIAAAMPTSDVIYTALWTKNTITINTQPQGASVGQFESAPTLSVVAAASNNGALSYQWQSSQNGSGYTDIDGATNATYTVPNITVGTTYYQCVVSAAGVLDEENKTTTAVTVVVNGGSSNVNDLVEIAADYTYTPSAAIPLNTLAEDGRIIAAAGGCNYTSNGLNIKDIRYIAFKVAAGATISARCGNYGTSGARNIQLGSSTGTLSNLETQTVAQGEEATLTYTYEAGGVVYLSASADLYIKELNITYPVVTTWYIGGNFDGEGDWELHELTDGVVTINNLTAHTAYPFKIYKHVGAVETIYGAENQINSMVKGGEDWTMTSTNTGWNVNMTSGLAGNYTFTVSQMDTETPHVVVTYPESWVVTFDMQGKGGNNYVRHVLKGTKVERPNRPEASGFTFGGWFTNTTGEGSSFDFENTNITEDITLYAYWSQDYYILQEWDHNWQNQQKMTRSENGKFYYFEVQPSNENRYFKIQRNGVYYDCRQTIPGHMFTDVTNMNDRDNIWGALDYRAGVHYNSGNYYILVLVPNTDINTTANPVICAATEFPYQLNAGKTIYYDNSVTNWEHVYFRIGRKNHNLAPEMTKVPGTANLYKFVTTDSDNGAYYKGYTAFNFANNYAWTGDNSIYDIAHSQSSDITDCSAYAKYDIDADYTFTPGESDQDAPHYYPIEKTAGMKTDNVAITAPSNGTITVAYTDVDGNAQSFTEGNRDLAHTVKLTITTTPAKGYKLAENGLVVTGANLVNDEYVVTAATTISATFERQTVAVTLDRNGGEADGSATCTYGDGSCAISVLPTRAGYTLIGFYTSNDRATTVRVMDTNGSLGKSVAGFTDSNSKWICTDDVTIYAMWTKNPTGTCGTGVLTWNLEVGAGGSSRSTISTTSTSKEFSETGISTLTDLTAIGLSYTEDKGKANLSIPVETPAAYDADKYLYTTFTVENGHAFTPCEVVVKAQPITTNKMVKVELTDGVRTISTEENLLAGGIANVILENGGNVAFEGTVTLKIYCYGATDKFRIGSPITIRGAIAEDLTIATGETYTISTGTETYSTLTIQPNAELVVESSATLNVTNLVFQMNEADQVASAKIDGTVDATNVYLELNVTSANWHAISLPSAVNTADVKVDGIANVFRTASGWYMRKWNGAGYSDGSKASTKGWDNVTTKPYDMTANTGYLVGAGHSDESQLHSIRFPITLPTQTADYTNSVQVHPYPNEVASRGVNFAGWNYIGIPYASGYETQEFGNYKSEIVTYAQVGGNKSYRQVWLGDITLKPFTGYFFQVGDEFYMDFQANDRVLMNKPVVASVAARVAQEETKTTSRVSLVLTNAGGEKDETSLSLNDEFTTNYEFGREIVKMFGSSYKNYTEPVVYTQSNAGQMAINALPYSAAQMIPVGFYAAADGTYTFSLNEKRDMSGLQAVYLIDTEEGITTNLMLGSYEFGSSRQANNETRFYISIEKKTPGISTGVDSQDDTAKVEKVMINGRLYILKRGHLFDAQGKMVK